MNTDEYLQWFKETTDKMYEVTKAKNADYTGSSNDAHANFKMVEKMGICSVEQGFLTRMTDKMSRIASLTAQGNEQRVADEKVEDTLQDLAVYSLLFLAYLETKRK